MGYVLAASRGLSLVLPKPIATLSTVKFSSFANDQLENPRTFEDLHKKYNDIQAITFEGTKMMLYKGLSNHFQKMDLNGFDRGLEAEKVITIVDQAEKTFISVQFKGQPSPELIPVDVAHRKISGMLIEFYAAHLRYESSDQDEEVEVMVKKKRKIQSRGKGKTKPDTRENNMGKKK